MPEKPLPPGPALRELRERCGLTQVELAVRAGCSLNTVGAAERHGVVSRQTAAKLGKALSCSARDVLLAASRQPRTRTGPGEVD